MQRENKRVHEVEVDHARLIQKHHFCLQLSQRVAAEWTAAFGRNRAPF